MDQFTLKRIRHLLIDLDGVLYRGNTPLAGAADFVAWLRARGITFRLVTNNATLTQVQYVAKLQGLGIPVSENEVFTSALAASLYLQERDDAHTAYVIGEDGLIDALQRAHIQLVEERPDWVVVGLDRHLTYEKLAIAALAIASGTRFLGTNPDTSFPAERGLLPGAGAIQAAISATTGVSPIVVGKPQSLMFELALKQLGGTLDDSAMLGDRLDTDIAGAHNVGMPSILVLTGVSTRDDIERSPVVPSLVVEDLPALMTLWASHD
jgi:4-nitrophenyl phosphatase